MTDRPDSNNRPAPEDQRQSAYSGYEAGSGNRGGYQRQGIAEAAAKSFIRSIAASLGRILVRAITGRMR
jgi:hypothetical protein